MNKTPEQEYIAALEALNERLAQQIVGFSDRVQASIRPALAKAWDEGYGAGKGGLPFANPYKGETQK